MFPRLLTLILLPCALLGQDPPAPEAAAPAPTLPWHPQAAAKSAVVGPDFAVLAVGGDGRPVVDFRALLTAVESAEAPAFQAAGRHGVAEFQDVQEGKYHLWVVPEDPWLMPGPHCLVEVKGGGARTLQVQGARGRVERQLRLLQRSGDPCCRVRVELLQVLVRGLPTDQPAVPLLRPVDAAVVPRLLLLLGGVTDPEGRFVLHGPQDGACVLRVWTDPAECEVLAPIRFDTTAPLTLQLGGAIALAGRLGPPAFLAELRAMMGVAPKGPLAPAEQERMPRVRALRTDAPELDWPEILAGGRGAVRVAADGSFLLPDLAGPGRHVLLLETPTSIWRIGDFAPSLGELCEREFGRSDLALGRLAARVTVDGAPAAGARMLFCSGGPPPRDSGLRMGECFTLDADGNVDLAVPAGSRVFTCLWRVPGGRDLELRTPVLRFEQGAVLREPIAISTAPLRVQTVDARGRPLPGVVLQLRDPDGVHRDLMPVSDYRGYSELGRIEVQKFSLHALPRSKQIEAEGMAIAWLTGESFQVGEATPGAATTVIKVPWFWSR